MAHLVLCNEAAYLEQAELAAARVGDGPVPLALAPAVEQIDGAPPYAREVLERLLHRAVELLVVYRIDRRADVGCRLAFQVGATQKTVDLGPGIEQMGDQSPESRERGPVAV